MPNTALNRTTQVLLTNKSGGAVSYGNVVIVDTTTDSSFTTTTTGGISTAQLGVVLEPNGIASNALGMVAVGGWAPRCTLNTAATRGQFIKSHTVAGQGTPHSSPQVEGDFAVALEASATPAIAMFGSPNGPLTGGAGTVTHTAGALTANAVVVGNASADITVLASLGTSGQVLTSNGAGTPPSFQAAVAGSFVLVEQHTAAGSASLDFTTGFTSTYSKYMLDIDGITPGTNGVDLYLRISTDGGATFITTANYRWTGYGADTGNSSGISSATAVAQLQLTNNGRNLTTAGTSTSGTIYLANMLNATNFFAYYGNIQNFISGTSLVESHVGGTYTVANTPNAVRLIMSAGTIALGSARLYGLAK